MLSVLSVLMLNLDNNLWGRVSLLTPFLWINYGRVREVKSVAKGRLELKVCSKGLWTLGFPLLNLTRP